MEMALKHFEPVDIEEISNRCAEEAVNLDPPQASCRIAYAIGEATMGLLKENEGLLTWVKTVAEVPDLDDSEAAKKLLDFTRNAARKIMSHYKGKEGS